MLGKPLVGEPRDAHDHGGRPIGTRRPVSAPEVVRTLPEVYIFRLREGEIVQAWGIEDTLGRLEQLGLR